jgi:two-component system OmpR family response regulator
MAMLTFLVEDSLTIRQNLIPALEDLGGAEIVAVAETEDEAKEWLGSHAEGWDLAVVDMFLREGNGIGVVAVCRNRQEHQRVAVLTNYATETIRQRCLNAGADAVFDKSTQLEEFFDYCQQNHS